MNYLVRKGTLHAHINRGADPVRLIAKDVHAGKFAVIGEFQRV